MLQALSNEGQLITLALLPKREIEQIRRNKRFYCPTCHQPVIVKAGEQIVPHFAHRSDTNCIMNEGGEGIYHETGKLLLYRWLKKQYKHVELEHYIQEINQRPDILLTIGKKRIAIEFQTAIMTDEIIIARNQGYHSINIIPIWILGMNRLKQRTKNIFNVNHFTRYFIQRFSPKLPSTLFYFCPHTSRFIVVTDVYLITMRIALGVFHQRMLQRIQFKDLFLKHYFRNDELSHLWINYKRKFRLQIRKPATGHELTWRTWLYEKGVYIDQLPSIINLPVPSQHLMKVPLWNWQSKLVLELIHPLQIGQFFTIQQCRILLKEQMLSKTSLPFLSSYQDPIRDYLHCLVKLKLIIPMSNKTYKKIQTVFFHKNVEESVKGDEQVIQQLLFASISI